jgi:hypothetical protein
MSTIAVNAITNAAGGNTATINGMTPTADSLQGFRNRIINGDMRIDQRNAGVAINLASTPFGVDRFGAAVTTALFTGNGTIGQSTVAPAGFTNSLLWTQTTGVTPSASQIGTIYQGIEGNNIADFGFGTADAKQVTLSFWVRSSITGTYCAGLRNGDTDRSYIAEYSVSAANTWEYKTITIAGDTSGTWTTDNTAGIYITWDLGSGSNSNTTAGSWAAGNFRNTTNQVSFVGNSGATFYITGVQLEAGSVATPFERRPYGTELALCQRYYYQTVQTSGSNTAIASGFVNSTTEASGLVTFPVSMRVAPTALVQNGTAADYDINRSGGSVTVCSAVPTFNNATVNTAAINYTVASGLTAGQAVLLRMRNSTSYLAWSAEL